LLFNPNYTKISKIQIFCIITLTTFPLFINAGYPPEWVFASSDDVTQGETVSGDYTGTYYKDSSYHEIQCYRHGTYGYWEAIVFYGFAGKCSKVKIWVRVDPLIYGNCFNTRAYYTDDTSESLGNFNPQSYYEFDLNSGKYLESIRIQYYLASNINPVERYIFIDYISCYWTGNP
jgi:hypothetical protein